MKENKICKKFFLIFLLFVGVVFANDNYAVEYSQYKMDYLRAILNGNETDEKNSLEKIIKVGQKLNIDITKYQKELQKFTPSKTPQIDEVDTDKKPVPSKFNIDSVYTQDNKIVINFNNNLTQNDIKFFELHYKNLHKDIYDIKAKFKDAKPTKLSIKGVDRISIAQFRFNTLRIVIANKKDLKTKYYFEKDKLIIEIPELKSETLNTNYKNYSSKNKIVVIDAGHGGKDAGAVGPKKRYEKNTVFEIAKELNKILKNRGYTVYMTRTKDKFIKVKNRTKLANDKKADIFISIHANAARKNRVNKAKGIETFFLSPARSERAKRVAELENSSDIGSMSSSSKNAFLESLNRPRITASQKLAIDIHQHMLYNLNTKYNDIVDGGVREGPFWVLVSAQMPSILIEVGYISHPVESRRLFTKNYQKLLADGIADGVSAYFSKNP